MKAPLKVRFAAPTLVSVTVCGPAVVAIVTVPNGNDAGEIDRDGAGAAAPVPVSEKTWGFGGALLLTWKLVVRIPSALGLNVRLIVQLPPAAIVVDPARGPPTASAPAPQ